MAGLYFIFVMLFLQPFADLDRCPVSSQCFCCFSRGNII